MSKPSHSRKKRPQLLLLRHGKSDWSSGEPTDHERALAPRGIRASGRMGLWIRERDWTPAMVHCSTALRCRQTLNATGWLDLPDGPTVHHPPELYHASGMELAKMIQNLAGDGHLVVGHEPGLSEAIALLTGAKVHFPTACLVHLEGEGQHWELCGLYPPRVLFP